MYNMVVAVHFEKGSYFEELNRNYECLHYKSLVTGVETWTKYDDKGREIYFKNINCEIWMKYDEYSTNVEYMKSKDSDGTIHENWWEYNHEVAKLTGEYTDYRSSNGSWSKCEYDNYGRIIRYTNSMGFEQLTDYDDKNQIVHVKDNEGFDATYPFEDLDIEKVKE